MATPSTRPRGPLLQALRACTCAVLAGLPAFADTPSSTDPTADGAEPPWSFSTSVAAYLIPDTHDYLQPTLQADHHALHLEARYQYEALDTGSFWIGGNVSGGRTVSWAFTPMLGGVFGETTGIAPGYRASIGWWKLELATEGEYVLDVNEVTDRFFYSWTELSISPVDWLRFGAVTQRTRAYESERDLQRGLLAGFAAGRFDFTSYFFDLDLDQPTVVLALGVGF